MNDNNMIFIKYSKITQYSYLVISMFLIAPFLNSTFATHGYLFILRLIFVFLSVCSIMFYIRIICYKEVFAIIGVNSIFLPLKNKEIYIENITDIKIINKVGSDAFQDTLQLEIKYIELIKGKEKKRKLVIPENLCTINLIELKKIIEKRK